MQVRVLSSALIKLLGLTFMTKENLLSLGFTERRIFLKHEGYILSLDDRYLLYYEGDLYIVEDTPTLLLIQPSFSKLKRIVKLLI